MLKFNNQHIFTGYIKQLLSNFNLPKYVKGEWPATKYESYYYNKYIPNQTKNLEIRSNIYDSYTHEYLGDFLRFQRDYNGLDLMPLYNCFSDRQPRYLSININNTYRFDPNALNTKIYMVPVKFGKKYTLAIDSEATVELCCGFYGSYEYYNKEKAATQSGDAGEGTIIDDVPALTYQKFNKLSFNSPTLIDCDIINKLQDKEFAYEHEQDLKLYIKLPAENRSSITILEGDYRTCGDTISYFNGATLKCKMNEYAVNLAPTVDDEEIDFPEDMPLKPMSRLQLLTFNSGESYPFSDKLIEYLTGMAITNEDDIEDNILRAQMVMGYNSIGTASGTNETYKTGKKRIVFAEKGA